MFRHIFANVLPAISQVTRFVRARSQKTITRKPLLLSEASAPHVAKKLSVTSTKLAKGIVPADLQAQLQHWQRHRNAAEQLNLLRKHKIQQSAFWHGVLMSLRADGKLREAHAMFSEFRPSTRSYNILISGHCFRRELSAAEALVSEMLQNGLLPDVFTYSTMISAWVHAKQFESALELYEEMKKHNVVPNAVVYNTVLNLRSEQGDLPSAERIISEMQAKNIQPDVISINTMIKGYGRIGDTASAERYFRMLPAPTGRGFIHLVSAYATVGDMAGAESVILRMHAHNFASQPGERPHVALENAYASLLHGYTSQNNVDAVMSVVERMRRHSVAINEAALTTVVNAMVHSRQFRDAEKLLDEIQSKVVEPSLELYTTIMHLWVERYHLPNVQLVWARIAQANLKPDLIAYNCLLNAYAKLGQMDFVRSTLLEMADVGIVPDASSYSIALNGYSKAGDVQNVERLFTQLQATGQHLTPIMYHTVLASLCGSSLMSKALQLVELIRKGPGLSVFNYTTLMQTYFAQNDVVNACKWAKELKSSGLKLDDRATTALAQVRDLENRSRK